MCDPQGFQSQNRRKLLFRSRSAKEFVQESEIPGIGKIFSRVFSALVAKHCKFARGVRKWRHDFVDRRGAYIFNRCACCCAEASARIHPRAGAFAREPRAEIFAPRPPRGDPRTRGDTPARRPLRGDTPARGPLRKDPLRGDPARKHPRAEAFARRPPTRGGLCADAPARRPPRGDTPARRPLRGCTPARRPLRGGPRAETFARKSPRGDRGRRSRAEIERGR